MSDYKAPVRDMKFVLNEVFNVEQLLASMPGTAEVNAELINSVLEEAGKVAEGLLAPLNRQGDEIGCQFDGGKVTTPGGFKDAYRTFAEGGWIGLAGDPQYGGQGMPKTLAVCFEEMIMAANSSLALYAVLSAGASLAISRHASDDLKQAYLPKLYDGSWSATMCLTEPHAGTDLGMIKTRAVPQSDGSYKVSGTKIFITGGEHDLSENIIHLVLAKLPDAPAGPRGISLFLVPKFLPDGDGNVGDSNGVSCGSIEHKMGLKGSATCVMNFDDATGYLVGEINKGLACMFTMMNYERLTIGLQGLGLGDASYQTAAAYARERIQGRSPAGPAQPDKAADSLLVHPDVRRMLLNMRANTEAGRALAAYVGNQLDIVYFHPDEERQARAAKLVALLTPITKAAFTDRGFEACVLGQQVLGGHGYVREWGQEQHVRDARIAQIYEGTNGIQALDLMGRKVVFDREGMLEEMLDEMRQFIDQEKDGRVAAFVAALDNALDCLVRTTDLIRQANTENPHEVGAASVPYLDLMTLILYCYMWARMVKVAEDALAAGTEDSDFYRAKIQVGCYFLDRIMPRYKSLAEEISAGSDVVMALDEALF
ncbi:acyl-CoA dehydrogenase C-terminal domain-containing protein [Pseudohongiella spirulinae]|uniref:acyl-CoA dehydrogenase C-terminal domain-containing protein n=1 Tax=Pseudohongiella spirulinae TaxID=1249552 RepID=UPI00071756AF|nr:acyl-CoA dehydrogenase C-terminal domain-containing protein [Pseudohongiella spirulinae]